MVIYTQPERANISKSLKTEFTVTIMLNGNLFHTQTPLSRHRQMKAIENVKNQAQKCTGKTNQAAHHQEGSSANLHIYNEKIHILHK